MAKSITSSSNKYVKEIRDLQRKARYRRERKLFVAEGERLCEEIPPQYIENIFLTEGYHGRLPKDFARLETEGHVFTLPRELMAQISDTKTSQGILCTVQQKPEKPLQGDLLLILETIQDPGNLGTIFRTAEAAGVQGILMNRETVDVYSPKVVRSTMGALFRMPFQIADHLEEAVEGLKAADFSVYAAHLKGEKPHYGFDFRKPTAFLIGNEGNGLSDSLASHATDYLRIPMEGEAESLNAGIAAAVLVYEAHRQRHKP